MKAPLQMQPQQQPQQQPPLQGQLAHSVTGPTAGYQPAAVQAGSPPSYSAASNQPRSSSPLSATAMGFSRRHTTLRTTEAAEAMVGGRSKSHSRCRARPSTPPATTRRWSLRPKQMGVVGIAALRDDDEQL